jgi:hypothetical protein
MALRAKYEADFADFYSATAQAVTSLDTWEDKGAAVEKQMDSVAHSLTGAPVTTDIQGMSSSMDEFGVKTVNTAGLVDTEATGMSSAFTSIGLAIAGAFTVQQIGAFLTRVMDTASEIGDLSAKLGISTEAVQRFGFAADQSGSSIGDVERAINTMNKKLAAGDDSTIAALGSVGLELQELRDSGPEQAFIAIGDAAAGIADPMQQAAFETEMFGKSGTELTQTFVAGIREIGSETPIMVDETIRQLKEAQDAWSRFGNAIVVLTGGPLASAITAVERASQSWVDFGVAAVTAVMPFPGIRDKVNEAVDKIRDFSMFGAQGVQAATELGMAVATIPPAAQMAVNEGFNPVIRSGKEAATVIQEMTAQAHFSTTALGLVEPKLGTLSQATANMARGTDSLAAVMKTANDATQIWNSGLTFTSEVIGELPSKVQAATSAIQNMSAAQGAAGVSAGMDQKSQGASVPFDMGNITYGTMGFAKVFEEYTKKNTGGGALGGFIGGGPPKDFVTWALSMGLAQRGPTVTNTFNIVDTESNIARRVGDTITSQIQKGSLVN